MSDPSQMHSARLLSTQRSPTCARSRGAADKLPRLLRQAQVPLQLTKVPTSMLTSRSLRRYVPFPVTYKRSSDALPLGRHIR